MNRPYDVMVYQRRYADGYPGTVYRNRSGSAESAVEYLASRQSWRPPASILLILRNGQKVIVRPLSEERRRQREEARKAREWSALNPDGTISYATATRLAMAPTPPPMRVEERGLKFPFVPVAKSRGYGE